jgi:hypothetical protein
MLLQVMIGPENTDWEESFDVVLCTPKWMERKYGRSGIISGYHHLIVFEYNYSRIVRDIEDRCVAAEGHSWRDVATKLSTFGHWEFEGYVEYGRGIPK